MCRFSCLHEIRYSFSMLSMTEKTVKVFYFIENFESDEKGSFIVVFTLYVFWKVKGALLSLSF